MAAVKELLTALFVLTLLLHSTKTDTSTPRNGAKTQRPSSKLSSRATVRVGVSRHQGMRKMIKQLKSRVDILEQQTSSLIAQNKELRVTLETCGCYEKDCRNSVTGRRHHHNETWTDDRGLTCHCQNKMITCEGAAAPNCTSTPKCPCRNGGVCRPNSNQCTCPEGFRGNYCEHFPRNPCNFLPSSGSCSRASLTGYEKRSPSTRFYYDWNRQICTAFNYSGCGGSANNFPSKRNCERTCLQGACCVRHVTQSGGSGSTQECLDESLASCKRRVRPGSPLEVVSFNPGASCDVSPCGGSTVHTWRKLCPVDCRPVPCSRPPCRCARVIERREIRDLSLEERWLFQQAVGALAIPSAHQNESSTWESLQDLYTKHIMHASKPQYFLLWHRIFLRVIEHKLQQVKCPVAIPYYDFTTDASNFGKAMVWQANFFGGNGENGGCVRYHPFGNYSHWAPCIVRAFNTSVPIPSMLEVAHILQTEDFLQFSKSLQALVGYLHTFIGGTMMSPTAAYDPIFLSIYAYIDKLFWQWQQRHPQGLQNIKLSGLRLEPFRLTIREALNEASPCVTYIAPSEGCPCNMTRRDLEGFPYGGYGVDGFDSIGYDRFGFDREGYGRDGYNRKGYDRTGYDRYGLDYEGFNRQGFNRQGYDRHGRLDNSGVYNNNGMDIFCRSRAGLTETGYDQFGFNANGLDGHGCGFRFRGPHSPNHVTSLWLWVQLQPSEVLANLGRTCPPLTIIDSGWWRQCWVQDIPVIIGLIRPVGPTVTSYPGLCWDAAPYISSCSCTQPHVTCPADPCEGATCQGEPEARCVLTTCGRCGVMWVLNGRQVTCEEPKAVCALNSCLNGGSCQPSRWPHRPTDVLCVCPPHFEGDRCERRASQVCLLPLDQGTCSEYEDRWYYDSTTSSCKVFRYSGCGGNGNSFPTLHHCTQRCILGACCLRKQMHQGLYGYNTQGLDRYGFSEDGQSIDGTKRTRHNGLAFGEDVYDSDSYNKRGYDRDGFNKEGHNAMGYNRHGYNQHGFNLTGYDRLGDYDGDINYNTQGYDIRGYNRAGYSCSGHNARGLGPLGYVSGHEYTCNHVREQACLDKTTEGYTISSFTAGKHCHETTCQPQCGCQYGLKNYTTGDSIPVGCSLTAQCGHQGKVKFTCNTHRQRKEIRDMTQQEWSRLHSAIRNLSSGKPDSKWSQFTELFAAHSIQLRNSQILLPWLRYFLHQVETALQEVDCHVTMPYFDWTLDAGDMKTSQAWQANAFGGDGELVSHCVKRHPFQDPYTAGWSPCLRRQFNPEVPLPHTILVHTVLREPDFTLFSRELMLMSDQFRHWVGGHANTQYAAYDPMFLTHAAFLDKLWEDWQQRHPMGVFTFSPELRYVPTAPFKLAPEDVFSSELQLCVRYLDLTGGIPCLTSKPSTPPLVHTDFDLEGFDIDGYDRNGFDSIGFNRFGFGRDAFNRDGFNQLGYDRLGYNRLGLDMDGFTPQGLHINGTFRETNPGADKLYDTAGYNRYGFNRYGYTRAGFDAFGFSAEGYDMNGCNYYHQGPFYVLQAVALGKVLNGLTPEELLEVPVTCPNMVGMSVFSQVTPPTQGRFSNNQPWLPVLPHARLCTVLPHFTQCGLGVAETPCNTDLCTEPLCLQQPQTACWTWGCGGTCLPVWYDVTSGKPVRCTGCTDTSGVVHADAASWRPDPCTSCTCESGVITCGPDPPCPLPDCANSVTPLNSCCPSCDACQFGGSVYADGTEVSVPNARCQQCRCRHGNVLCEPIRCPPVPEVCQNVTTPTGECCPQCADCDVTSGNSWRDERCHLCVCQEGIVRCEKQACPPVKCSHPVTTPTTCCPQCKECQYEGRVVRNGHTWRPDACRPCHCHQGNVRCEQVQCPSLSCDQPVYVPGQCCPQCQSGCEYSKTHYEDGATFLAPYNTCLQCTCRAARVTCHPVACPPTNLTECQNPVPQPGECCPSRCPECTHAGSQYPHGSEWESGQCEVCQCVEGVVSCRLAMPCPSVPCPHGAAPQGECCPVCHNCSYNGLVYADGSSFTAGSQDSCTECTCSKGVVACHQVQPCQPVRCHNPKRLEGRCCAECQGCSRKGVNYKDGDEVPSTKDCHRCVCDNGRVVCRPVTCPPLTCGDVIHLPGVCCPVCSECHHDGAVYRSGQQFNSSRDPCLTCLCKAREVTCSTIQCPTLPCPAPLPPPHGECCPVCQPDGCKQDGRQYREGEQVPGEVCQVCRCTQGAVRCHRKECQRTDCPFPVPGECCPSCEGGCLYGDQQYPDGGSFPDPRGEPCSQCTCLQGHITCERTPCPSLTCTSPATPVGACCPVCQDCFYEDNIVVNGEEFTSGRDPCASCICQSGTVNCHHKQCPAIECDSPRQIPGQCCPQCQGCQHLGRAIREGQTVPGKECEVCRCTGGRIKCSKSECPPALCTHSVLEGCCPVCKDCEYEGYFIKEGFPLQMGPDGCTECHCRAGSVTCERRPCPPVNCAQPRPGKCCPECDEPKCHYDGQVFVEGQMVPVPGRPCQECRCQEGRIHCSRVQCPPTNCVYPLQGECCPSCGGCTLERQNHNDGQNFPDPRGDPCYECTCRGGNVTCGPLPCPQPECTHPVTAEGACCRTCTDCEYEGHVINEGSSLASGPDGCTECYCRAGSVTCERRPCPPVSCAQPRPGKCCPECDEPKCHYDGRDFAEGQVVPVTGRPCEECRCHEGRIHCSRVQCLKIDCLYPLQGECCPSCAGCTFNSQSYSDDDHFPDPRGDPCYECTCRGGNVTCGPLPCPEPECTHPVTGEGACCRTCTDCMYEGRLLKEGSSLPLGTDGCTECYCRAGSVTCELRPCPPVSCAQPQPGKCCPECNDPKCHYNGQDFAEGHVVPVPGRPCEECQCIKGRIKCERTECPTTTCIYPLPGSCCPSCAGCYYGETVYQNQEHFPDPRGSPCHECICSDGNVTCQNIDCPRSTCPHPVTSPDKCCPQCTDCSYEGQLINNGDSVSPVELPCMTCRCEWGTVTCEQLTCPTLSCSHPAPETLGGCCPTCDSCLYYGIVLAHGDRISDPLDECSECVCAAGSVSCSVNCPPPSCTHPAPGPCCPVCKDCLWRGQTLQEGDRVPDPADACADCICKDGSVTCQRTECPSLTCVSSSVPPGQCCPVCQGCEDGGRGQEEGSVWRREGSSCEVCRCYNGVTVCAPASCLTPCEHPVSLSPQHCCPVCSGCEFNGVPYKEGDSFSPSGHPCDVCLCQDGHLHCYKQPCPTDHMCTEGHLLPPEPGRCCGTCTEVRTLCEKADVGMAVQPTADPCFTCQCQAELTFTCSTTSCPTLDCPQGHLVSIPASCCMQCTVCVVPGSPDLLPTGNTWSDPADPCRSCSCQDGYLVCSYIDCQPLVCGEGTSLSIPTGNCCPTCIADKDLDCQYGNITYKFNTRWRVDECTYCECGVSHQVSCRTQRCPPSECSANQSPTLVPGECCPICITKPGTCTAFGDPHYTTFDGQLVSFQGACSYVMAADCNYGNFTIEVNHDDRNMGGAVTWVGGIKVKIGGTIVELRSHDQVLVEGNHVTLPYVSPPTVFVEKSGSTLIVYTHLGVKVTWDAGSGHVELSVPGSYQGALCGLCGNFNGFPQDDMTSRGGHIVTSVASFGNSWVVPSNAECKDAADTDTCTQAGYRVKRLANTKCAPIKGPLFTTCHRVVAPQPFFASCVYDLCACADQDTCLCDVMSAYARACAQAGVTIQWRTRGRCAIGCPEDLGLVFDECGPRCRRTCENRHVNVGSLTSQCLRPCVPGCQCPAHLLLHQGRCIPEAQCPPITFENEQQ